jgi:hypothetical protein
VVASTDACGLPAASDQPSRHPRRSAAVEKTLGNRETLIPLVCYFAK